MPLKTAAHRATRGTQQWPRKLSPRSMKTSLPAAERSFVDAPKTPLATSPSGTSIKYHVIFIDFDPERNSASLFVDEAATHPGARRPCTTRAVDVRL